MNDPSHIGTSYLFTISGSKGDVCTHTRGALVFRSRAMQNNNRLRERIEILVPGFEGTGTYRNAIASAVVGRRTVLEKPALVQVTKSTGREVFARVHADKLRPQSGIVPWRIYGWMRCSVSG